MYEIKIEKLVLKKNYELLIKHFYDVSTDFFLLLLIHPRGEPFKIAFFKAGAVFRDYAINLDSDNTRTLGNKSFEFEHQQESLELSLILLENSAHQTLNLTKIKKLVHKYAFRESKNTGIIFHQLLNIKIPMMLYQANDTIQFNNSFITIEFSLK